MTYKAFHRVTYPITTNTVAAINVIISKAKTEAAVPSYATISIGMYGVTFEWEVQTKYSKKSDIWQDYYGTSGKKRKYPHDL